MKNAIKIALNYDNIYLDSVQVRGMVQTRGEILYANEKFMEQIERMREISSLRKG